MDAYTARALRLIAPLLAVAAMLLAVPATASAAEGYNRDDFGGCYGRGIGSADVNGVVYLACASELRIHGLNGNLVRSVPLGADTPLDLAPSPNGQYVYVASANSTIYRIVRGADGSYAADTTWRLQQYRAGGQLHNPVASYVATDAHGDIYIVTNNNDDGPSYLVKYRADGTFISANGGSGTMPGNLRFPRGLAVTRDGRTVYTTEHASSRIQRWEYAADGEYHSTASWGSDGMQCTGTIFESLSDIGVDPWGYVYVADGGCRRIIKLDRLGTVVWSGLANTWVLGLGVDGNGNVYTSYGDRFWRTTPVPGPWPAVQPLPPGDREAPVVTSLTVPATSTVRTINVGITATDNVGVTHMRFGDEQDVYGPWIAYATNAQVTLTAGYGTKLVQAQVRDAAGRISPTVSRTVTVPEPPDTTAPMLNGITVPATTTTQTISVGLSATDNKAVTQVRLANENGIWGTWRTYAATVQHTLSGGYGGKVVYVQVRDAAGNESNVLNRPVDFQAAGGGGDGGGGDGGGDGDGGGGGGGATPDVTAPVVTQVTVPARTTVRTISVQIAASDNVGVALMRLANEGGTWTPWKTFATSATHVIADGYGSKNVLVQVRDAAGNNSAIVTRSLVYEAPPTDDGGSGACTDQSTCSDGGSGDGGGGCVDQVVCGGGVDDNPDRPVVTQASVAASVNSLIVPVTVAATDDDCLGAMRFANENLVWGLWVSYADTRSHTLSTGAGAKTFYVQVRDCNGTMSAIVQLTTTVLPFAAPRATYSVPRATLRRTIVVRMAATDADGRVVQMRIGNRASALGTWRTYATRPRHRLTSGYGPKYVYVQVRDNDGKVSSVVRRRVIYARG